MGEPGDTDRRTRERRLTDPGDDATTVHVRSALTGNAVSLEWLVVRFSPVLLVHARWCLGARLSQIYDPEDLVQETWAVALPKLQDFVPRGPRSTPPLIQFLSTILVNLANRLISRHIARGREIQEGSEDGHFDDLAVATRGVITSVVRRERESQLAKTIARLSEIDRTILVMRALEGRSARDVSVVVSLTEDAIHQRFSRTVRKLRELLPNSLFDDIAPE